jgi:RHS repeat-associated protein
VLSGTTTDYTHDAPGNRTEESVSGTATVDAAYNGASELTNYENSVANMTAATYDGDGLRASATTTPVGGSSSTQSFVWNTVPSIPELLMDTDNAYIYGPSGTPFEQVDLSTGTITYLVADALGSVRAVVSSAGSLTASTSYDAWGNPETSGGLTAVTPFGFAGGYTDPTGLNYLIGRYYDPTTGQFLSIDPDVAETGQPYAYTGDDPVNGVDPLGLCTIKGEGQLYPGACATTGAEAIAAEQEIQAQAGGGGFSITNGLKALANYGAGIGNGIVSTATFGQVHISAPYCNSLSWAYGVGSGFGYAIAAVGGGAAASAAAGSTTVGDLAYGSQSLGADSALFGNDTLGETADSGLLNQRGSTWKFGWSVDATVSPTSPGFRISTPFIDHWWITHASGF